MKEANIPFFFHVLIWRPNSTRRRNKNFYNLPEGYKVADRGVFIDFQWGVDELDTNYSFFG